LWFSSSSSGNSQILLCNRPQPLLSSSFKIHCLHSTWHMTYDNAVMKGLWSTQQMLKHAKLYTCIEISVCRYLMWKVMFKICEIDIKCGSFHCAIKLSWTMVVVVKSTVLQKLPVLLWWGKKYKLPNLLFFAHLVELTSIPRDIVCLTPIYPKQ
jgi:hypothetical protein